jgi:hypothetical protein
MNNPAPRLQLRQPVSSDGYLDGAWWPRSRDLATELPAVLSGLAASGHPIERVIYDLHYWAKIDPRLTMGATHVHLGGFNTAEPHLVSFIESGGNDRIDTVVLDPETDPPTAGRALDMASRPGNPAHSEEFLEWTKK